MAISVSEIQKLRNETGAGMMKAKEALEAANGDYEKAIVWLREKGEASAAKKADREARAGLIDSYVHSGRIGVLVEVNCETDFVARTEDFRELTRDIAMHVAASNPLYLARENVPEKVVENEKAIYAKEAAGKPEAVVDKIVDGKLNKYFEQYCLLEQPFIKDPDISVGKLVTTAVAKLGENIVVRRFSRMELGVE
jgi:elongation factor Ts